MQTAVGAEIHRIDISHLVQLLAVESYLVASDTIMQYYTTDLAPNWQNVQVLTLQMQYNALRCSPLLLAGA